MKICPKCGKQMQSVDDYCMECGERYVDSRKTVKSGWLTFLILITIIVILAGLYSHDGDLSSLTKVIEEFVKAHQIIRVWGM